MDSATDSNASRDGSVIRIALRILEDRERQHLSQIMALTAQRSGWTLLTVPSAEADVVFVNPDDPGSGLLLDRSRAGQLPLAVAYGAGGDAGFSLPKPARSAELHKLLGELRERLSQSAPTPPDSGPTRQDQRLAETEDYTDIISCLAGVRERPMPIEIRLDQDNHIAIDPRPGIAYLFGEQLRGNPGHKTSALSTLEKGALRELPRRMLTQKLVDVPSDRMSLEELAWLICHQSRPREQQPKHICDTAFRLRHWPNFSRLEHKPIHLLWAGSLMRGSMSLAQLAARSPDGMCSAARFYNSCLVSGLISHDKCTQSRVHGNETTRARSSVFRRIIDRLAG